MTSGNTIFDIEKKYYELFHGNPLCIQAPGRINLIGEHTDYNDGFVLPAAIDMSIYFAVAKNNENVFRFYSMDFDEMFTSRHGRAKNDTYPWVNYLLGVIAQFEKLSIDISGVDCVFGGNIPIGAGLSSSAALECGFAFGLDTIFGCNLSKYNLVSMAQKAEHEYAGVMCGIMDQFASVFGKKDYVFRLDCRSHEYVYFPLEMNNYIIALVDTKVEHELASSEYNLRRKECEQGVVVLKKDNPNLVSLRDVDELLLIEKTSSFDPIVYNRCHYVVCENQRVIKACNALEKSDFHEFGKLMYESHTGLRDEYEVSCKELDILVEATLEMNYVLGSRMMGGGFGGCTINLITEGYESVFKDTISSVYTKKTGIIPEIYFVKLSDGVRIINQ
mgnify:CR=1 FL=1